MKDLLVPLGGPRDRKIIGKCFKNLERKGLVDFCDGPRKGAAITQVGVTLLETSSAAH